MRAALALLASLACAPSSEPIPALMGNEVAAELDPPPVDLGTGGWVRLRRTRCYGACPAYAVTLHVDGRVAWMGHAEVGVLGPASATVDPVELARLTDRLAATTDITGRERCATDVQASTITIHDRIGERTVSLGAGCEGPDEDRLAEIASVIDRIAGAARWIATDPQCEHDTGVIMFDEGGIATLSPTLARSLRARLRARPDDAIRLVTHGDTAADADARRDAAIAVLVGAGLERDRIRPLALPASTDLFVDGRAAAVHVGPRRCFERSP